jgi:HlyD family secretion protein
MRPNKRLMVAVSAALVVCLGAYVSQRHEPGSTAWAGVPEGLAGPDEDAHVLFSAPGVTEPKSRTLQIVSELSGTLQVINVRAGDHVRRGQVLAALNNDIQQASVDLAQATLDRARAELAKLQNGDRPEERGVAKAQVDEAEASLSLAEFERRHVERMVEQNAVSDRELAQADYTLALAQARRAAAGNRWELSVAGPRSEDLRRAEATVREAEAQFDAAQGLLARTIIRSPIDGLVIYRFREPGETVFTDAPTPILSLGDRSELHVRVDVDEIDVGRVHTGQIVYATAPAYGARRFPGRVVHIEPTLGRKNFRTNRPTERVDTRVQEVVVALDQADEVPLELQMVVWFNDDTRRPPEPLAFRP